MFVLTDLLPQKFNHEFIRVALGPTLGQFGEGGRATIHDADTGRQAVTEQHLLTVCNDLKAICGVTGNQTTPGYEGACHRCLIRGFRLNGTTCYPSAACFLAPGDPLIARFEKEFEHSPDMLVSLNAPAFKTQRQVTEWSAESARIRATKRSEAAIAKVHFKGQKYIDAISTACPHFDSPNQVTNCLKHGIGNHIRDIFTLMKGKKSDKSILTPARQASEKQLGRLGLL